MKAIRLLQREYVEIQDVDDLEPGPGELGVRPDFVGLCGTDQHVFLGEFEDRVPYPAVLGHEFSGRVDALGEGVEHFHLGDRVVVDPVFPCGECPLCKAGRFNNCVDLDVLGLDTAGALAECVVVDAVNVFHLPDAVDPRHAVMAELYTVAVHAARLTQIEMGDHVVILGAGRLGLSLLDVMRRTGAQKIVSVDLLDTRLAMAHDIGADLVVNAREDDPVEVVMEMTGGLGADKVIEAVGRPKALDRRKPPVGMALQMMRPGGQITVMGQGEGEQPFDWRRLVLKEGRIVTSRLNLGDMPRALALMAAGVLHPGQIITHTVGHNDVQRGFEQMHSDPAGVVKVVVDMAGLGG